MGLDVKQVIVEEDAECRQGRGGVGLEEKVDEKEEEEELEDAKPIGEPVRIFGKGEAIGSTMKSSNLMGITMTFHLLRSGETKVTLWQVASREDPVLLAPEEQDQKPYVAILKDIVQTKDGNMMVTGQWFYCYEEGEKK
ncbi:hypothetical protein SAY86_004860 [Trapa natans]|uniref:BAH domain-containing protein n=1 Tax=Trapa natans TaxID=22666 RepID=A0AAN7N7F0_TRANT|nr:hypothetical protein SAY86_004860 [Trapa natans]